MRITDIVGIAELSIEERILLVEDLWDSIAADDAGIPVPQSHRDELDQRLRKHRSNPGDLLTLDQLHSRIAKRK